MARPRAIDIQRRDQKIIELHGSGWSRQKLAERFRLAPDYVGQIVREAKKAKPEEPVLKWIGSHKETLAEHKARMARLHREERLADAVDRLWAAIDGLSHAERHKLLADAERAARRDLERANNFNRAVATV